MEKTFKVFHYISFLQYPNLVLALYYCYRPLFTQFENIVEDYGNGLLFLGIGLSFTSLADLSKRTKITDYVFGKRKNARRWIIYMCSLLVIIFGFAVFLHFFCQ